MTDAAMSRDPRDIPLIDHFGERFHLRELRGQPAIVTFVASRCTDACPIANAEFSLLRASLRRARLHARLVTVTLDPHFDTPIVLANLARAYHVGHDTSWRFATGTPRDVARLMRSLGVVAERNRQGVPDVHGSFVYVFDPEIRLVRTILLSTGLDRDVAKTIREINRARLPTA